MTVSADTDRARWHDDGYGSVLRVAARRGSALGHIRPSDSERGEPLGWVWACLWGMGVVEDRDAAMERVNRCAAEHGWQVTPGDLPTGSTP